MIGLSWIIKHKGQDEYFHRNLVAGNQEEMSFTTAYAEAHRYTSQEEAERDLKWVQNPSYQIIEAE